MGSQAALEGSNGAFSYSSGEKDWGGSQVAKNDPPVLDGGEVFESYSAVPSYPQLPSPIKNV